MHNNKTMDYNFKSVWMSIKINEKSNGHWERVKNIDQLSG